MSKSIYVEALEIMIDNILPREGGKVNKTKVIKALSQAQQQEKLLELYQELDKINGWLLLCFTIGGEETEKEYYQLGGGNRRHELIKQIKELEEEVKLYGRE